MGQHVVIGTAGHVDHGKTALVKALTGTDTDRWVEEKRRGITIDLGFAAMDLAPDLRASVVDVPGHEDFVRNMVAGATGVDVALLVVAADEGVMPQTSEHLAILEFLGVGAGAVAVTKADLAEPDWIELVTADVRERLAGSPVHWEDPASVSSVSGAGLDTLRQRLATAARRARHRSASDLFRMPVDRVFTVAGAGTVVTGTTWSGTVAVGDEVTVLPAGARARVRGVEVHGEPRPHAEPGRRTALALVGLDRSAAARGSTVVAGSAWRATSCLDVIITLLPGARPVTQRTPLRLHLGTAEVMARVTPVEGPVRPGAEAPARLRLAQPLVARWGDRAVLRSASPATTVGGCVVVDPWPASRPRRPVLAAARAAADPLARVRAFLDSADGRGAPLPFVDLPVRLGLHVEQVTPTTELAVQAGAVRVGDALVSGTTGDARRVAAHRALEQFHSAHPLERGMPLELWRKHAGKAELARTVEAELVSNGIAVVEGAVIRLREFRPRIPVDLLDMARRVEAALAAAPQEGCTPDQVAEGRELREKARQLLEHLVRTGAATRVGQDRYYDRVALDRLRDQALAEIRQRGQVTPGELRETVGLTRKYLIPFLEWMDSQGFTVRTGDARRLGPAAHLPPQEGRLDVPGGGA
ncbi:MAG TPA: selenocysteine-specific translation elongation factor [Gemmatimonadales bacterium]|nr:selenocysteine-specific translation elongation factor [Gemmatimonadales bacterium]